MIPPGILTPATANLLSHVQGQSEENRRRLDSQPIDDNDLIPVKITNGSGGLHAWTRQIFSTTDGSRVADWVPLVGTVNGLDGATSTYAPAHMPDASTLTTFPAYGWLKFIGYTATTGPNFEIIGGPRAAGAPTELVILGSIGTLYEPYGALIGFIDSTTKWFTLMFNEAGTYLFFIETYAQITRTSQYYSQPTNDWTIYGAFRDDANPSRATGRLFFTYFTDAGPPDIGLVASGCSGFPAFGSGKSLNSIYVPIRFSGSILVSAPFSMSFYVWPIVYGGTCSAIFHPLNTQGIEDVVYGYKMSSDTSLRFP